MVDSLWKQRNPASPSPEQVYRISDQAYPNSAFKDTVPFKNVPDNGEVKVMDQEFVVLERFNDPATGADAYLVAPEDRSYAVMAIRGTEGGRDLVADGKYALGSVPEQAGRLSETLSGWQKKYEGKLHHWGVTGHSLGGIDVQYIVAMNGGSIDWAYNFSGPNLFPLLSNQEQAGGREHGHKLFNLGGRDDLIYGANRGAPMMGYMGYMDFDDPGNHNIGPQAPFDADGNPIEIDQRLHDVLVEVLGSGSRVGSKIVEIMVEQPALYEVMRRQLELEEHIEKARVHNGRILEDMREGFREIVQEFSTIDGVELSDVEQMAYECGLFPEDNVDQAALDEVDRNMRQLVEENRQWVETLAKVVERKVDDDTHAAKGFAKNVLAPVSVVVGAVGSGLIGATKTAVEVNDETQRVLGPVVGRALGPIVGVVSGAVGGVMDGVEGAGRRRA